MVADGETMSEMTLATPGARKPSYVCNPVLQRAYPAMSSSSDLLAINPNDGAPSERVRAVTWPVWFAWVFVCALVPIFSTVFVTAFSKQVSPNAEYREL